VTDSPLAWNYARDGYDMFTVFSQYLIAS